ncbi:nitrite reductase small subunit NirD [Streptomyces sp. GMY02]|uniref:nitrite reductase small subunit NirD n=1 Tax=Streptomyces sp. GMY02 TaxID=1333528 RepID=UPI001C2C7C53|nr:nitrite reductase small subunit NirD [Streptomyces sp. GMY02]QXE39388.1 nitrite reductase small subunit NirD [Streptomyces sp. GMY02]
MDTGSDSDTDTTLELRLDGQWFTVCALSALTPGRGVAALLPDGRQAAVFLDRSGRPYAIGNRDPFSGAHVLSRGLIGTHEGRTFVASPLLKQRFDLLTGRCLDDDEAAVQTYEVRVRARRAAAPGHVPLPAAPRTGAVTT